MQIYVHWLVQNNATLQLVLTDIKTPLHRLEAKNWKVGPCADRISSFLGKFPIKSKLTRFPVSSTANPNSFWSKLSTPRHYNLLVTEIEQNIYIVLDLLLLLLIIIIVNIIIIIIIIISANLDYFSLIQWTVKMAKPSGTKPKNS